MINFHFNNDPAQLPEYSESCHPVQIFRTHKYDNTKSSAASLGLLQKVRELGVNVDADAIDLITIATAVTAAETFYLREDAPDAWSRMMHLHVPVIDEEMWNVEADRLASILNFLTGDQWKFTFFKTSMAMPKPINSDNAKAK